MVARHCSTWPLQDLILDGHAITVARRQHTENQVPVNVRITDHADFVGYRCEPRQHLLTRLYTIQIARRMPIQAWQYRFNYDTQEYAYTEILRLLDLAIVNLQRVDGFVDAAYIGRFDKIYNGDRTKWLKYAYGLKAITLNHYSNKASYKPADVIANVDKAFASNADDALLLYPAAVNDDRNFFGPTRNNMASYRQTQFVVGLMNGT